VDYVAGHSDRGPIRPCFDQRPKLDFHGSRATSDAGLLAYRELDDAPGLIELTTEVMAHSRKGKNAIKALFPASFTTGTVLGPSPQRT
jgi:hypothetical protein